MIEVHDRAPAFVAPLTDAVHSIPVDIADAVQLWARGSGKAGARMYWSNVQCPVVDIELRNDDPRMKAWLEGKVPQKPKDVVFFHRQEGAKFVALNLQEMGASGVVRYLEEADLTTGRGRWRSMEDYLREMADHNTSVGVNARTNAVENARYRARQERRHIAGEPLVPVSVNLGE